jgi:hypothetical protein
VEIKPRLLVKENAAGFVWNMVKFNCHERKKHATYIVKKVSDM